jgi:hypothetical protein
MVMRGRQLVTWVGAGLLVAAALGGCERALVIPSGAQTVHATVTRDWVRIAPASVHAGMVYLTVDTDGTELALIGGDTGANGGLVGLTDAQLDAVLRGDLRNTFQGSGFRSGGELGNASELGDLVPGKYLFLPGRIVTLEPGAYGSIPLDAVAVLEVLP